MHPHLQLKNLLKLKDNPCEDVVSTPAEAEGLTFGLFPQTQTYEIILTLGQAFEVAYQMAIQSRARQYVPPSSHVSEVIETKTTRPASQSWSSMRRSAVSTTSQTPEHRESVCRWASGHETCTDIVTDSFLWITSGPPTQEASLCVRGRKWWVITLLPISSRPTPNSVTHSDPGGEWGGGGLPYCAYMRNMMNE